MILSIGKTPAFLLLLSLWTVCSFTAAAQDKKTSEIPSAESPSETLKIVPETNVNSASEKLRADETIDLSDALQTNNPRAETIRKYESNAEISEEKINRLSALRKTETDEFAYRFRLTGKRERQIEFDDSSNAHEKEFAFRPSPKNKHFFDDKKIAASTDDAQDVKTEGFRWRSAIGQMLMFLAVQHGYAMTQPKTREALKGKFWKDYADSVKSLHGWDDGGRFFTNYIAHPMQGSFTGFIYVQNDPKGLKQQFGTSGDYWRSRLKAMAWSAAWSTQFEIGPISQASIGNVGLKGKQTWEDIVVTPTLGTVMLIAEDAIDRFIIKRIERHTDNFIVKILSRGLLNPTRTVANVFRFKTPWYRDRPPGR